MPRVKRGVPAHKRHKRVLQVTKGQYGSRSKLITRANEARLKSLWYAYRDRRNRKRDMRRLWIVRINAAARLFGSTYHDLISGLNTAGIDVNRKMLAELAVNDQAAFSRMVEMAKNATAA